MRAILILVALSGCSAMDPYTRSGTWQPNGTNELNLAAMVSNPYDIAHGQGDAAGRPAQGTAAVDRLVAGKAKPLLPLDPSVVPGGGAGAK
jgi:hypothetical protein